MGCTVELNVYFRLYRDPNKQTKKRHCWAVHPLPRVQYPLVVLYPYNQGNKLVLRRQRLLVGLHAHLHHQQSRNHWTAPTPQKRDYTLRVLYLHHQPRLYQDHQTVQPSQRRDCTLLVPYLNHRPQELRDRWVCFSLIHRPCPAFCRLQYRKAGRAWHLFPCEHDVIGKWQIFAELMKCISTNYTLIAWCVRQPPPASQIRVVTYLVPLLFWLFWAQCAHIILNPFYHPFSPDITHVRMLHDQQHFAIYELTFRGGYPYLSPGL